MRLFYETNLLRFCYVILHRGHLRGFLLTKLQPFEEKEIIGWLLTLHSLKIVTGGSVKVTIEPVVVGVRL